MKKHIFLLKMLMVLAVTGLLSWGSISSMQAQSFCGAASNAGTISGYTASFQQTASVSSGSRWYWSTTLTAGNQYTFSNCAANGGTAADTYLRIYDAASTQLLTADDNCGANAELVYTAPTTGTYYIVLTNYFCAVLSTSQILAYREVVPPPPPPGGNCSNPIVIDTFPYSAGHTTCGAGNTYGIQCSGNYGGGEDLVFELQISTTGVHQIVITGTTTWIGWFLKNGSNCATTSPCLANAVSGSGTTATGTYNFTSTGTYYLIVDTWPTPTCGAFNLAVNPPSPPPGCASNFVETATPGCDNYALTFSWDAAPTATGYRISVGTTSGGTDIANNVNLGNVLQYVIPSPNLSTQYFYTVTPFNIGGDAVGCTEETFTTGGSGCACIPTYTSGKVLGDLISNVEIVGTTLSNNTGTAQVNPAFEYFTGFPNYTGDLQAGTSYIVNVTVGTWGDQHIRAWIDYNDDGIFDNSEAIGNAIIAPGQSNTGPFPPASFTISLACNPPVGVHRLRIRSVWSTGATLHTVMDPCASYGYGETEDYDINILAPPACPSPSAFVASNPTATSVTLNWNIGCTETAWEVEYGAPGFIPGAGTTVPATTNANFILSGLIGSSNYDLYLRADCGIDGVSSNFGPVQVATAPANDLCADAIAISCGQVVTGTTVNSSSTGNPGFCGTSLGTSGGVWYALQGVNGVMTAQLCGSSFDTKIGVFTGSCGSFTCVIGEDDDFINCGSNDPFVSWTGSSAQTYYIYVTGFSTHTGAFTLTTDCVTDYASFEYQTSNVTSVESCQEVTVQVNLVTFGPITNADLQLSYNTAELELVSAVAAHPIGPLYPVGNVITSTPGIIQYAVNTFGGFTPTGTATIPYLTLTFRGVQTPTAVVALVEPVTAGIGETQIVNFFGFDEFGLPMTQNVMSGAETLTVNVSPDTTVPAISGTIATTTIEACLATEVPAAVTSVAALEALGLTISDICTADEDLVVTSEDVPAGTCPIVVTRTYTVTDVAGNFSTTVQVINVDDTTAPVITCATVPGTLYFNSGVLYSVVGAEFDPIVSDDCGSFTVTHDAVSGGGIVAGADNVSLAGWGFPVGGPYTITFTAEDACGNVSDCSITFSVTPQEVNVTAIINMACNVGAAVRIQVFPVGAVLNGDVVATFDAALDGSGQFTQSLTGVPSGNYDVVIKVERYLAKKVSNVDFTSSTTSPNVSISFVIPGDIAGPGFADNIVGATDLSLLIFHYNTLLAGPNYNDRCDLNCDDKVDALDLSFLSFYYNTLGAAPWNN